MFINQPALCALVIDDDPNMRSLLRAVLTEVGWEVVEAANGQLGVEAFFHRQPALALIDIMMPVMDGLEVLAHIQAEAAQRRVPLLIMTALDDVDAMNQAFDLGAFDFINKPLNVRLIRRRLHALLQAVQVEHAIRRAKLEWEVTFDAVTEAVLVTNEQGEVIRCNRAAADLFGCSYAALLGRPLLDLFWGPDADSPAPAGVFTAAVSETQFPGLPGWFAITNHHAALEGQAASGVHIVRDITAQRQAEQALRESELHCRALVENLSEGIVLVGSDGTIKFASPAADTILGGAPGDLLGTEYLAPVHPDHLAANAQLFEQLLSAPGKVAHTHTQARHRDGTWRWLEVTAHNALAQPAVNAIVVTFHDITERRLAEESLALQAQVLENMAEGVFMTDAAGTIVFTNRAFDAMFGYADCGLLGQSARQLDVDPTGDTTGSIFAQLAQGKVWAGEIENRRKDGSVFVTDTRVSGIVLGADRYHVGLKTDITERRQTQAWITNTQKLADLGTLAAGVAHELNSPLQVITGVSESLLRRLELNTLEPAYLRRNLDVVHRNGWRCAEIIRSLHTYARASGGQLAPTSLNDLLRDGLLLMEHQLSSWSNITIQTELAADLPPLTCDRNQITQVLINLLTNARDAMPDGGTITLTTAYDEAAANVVLKVADTGSGIPAAVRSKIFDPFFTTKPIGKGTGLGLSIVAGIIQAYGGAITLTSQEGRGTTFTVQLPVGPPDAALAQAAPVSGGRFDESDQPH